MYLIYYFRGLSLPPTFKPYPRFPTYEWRDLVIADIMKMFQP